KRPQAYSLAEAKDSRWPRPLWRQVGRLYRRRRPSGLLKLGKTVCPSCRRHQSLCPAGLRRAGYFSAPESKDLTGFQLMVFSFQAFRALRRAFEGAKSQYKVNKTPLGPPEFGAQLAVYRIKRVRLRLIRTRRRKAK